MRARLVGGGNGDDDSTPSRTTTEIEAKGRDFIFTDFPENLLRIDKSTQQCIYCYG